MEVTSTASTRAMPVQASSIANGLLVSIFLGAALAWRFGVTDWDAVQTSCEVFFFVLGCCLLPRASHGHGASTQLLTALGVGFTILRMSRATYLAFIIPTPPSTYDALFSSTPWSCLLYILYAAEATFIQALLQHRLPGSVLVLLGSVQGVLHACIAQRYSTGAWWQMLRIFAMPQVCIHVPCGLLRLPAWKRGNSPVVPAASLAPSAKAQHGASKGAALRTADGDMLGSTTTGGGFGGVHARSCGHDMHESQSGSHRMHTSTTTSPAAKGGEAHLVPKSMAGGQQGSQAQARAAIMASVQALHQTPYKSRLRVPHMMTIKLDTHSTCGCLPPEVARTLQDAIRLQFGQATSLSISDVAVRPGCICLSLKIDEHGSGSEGMVGSSSLQVADLAKAVLPKLRGMLAAAQGQDAALTRATVQLDEQLVECAWSATQLDWQVRVLPVLGPESAAHGLGIATASSCTPTTTLISGAESSWHRADMLLEVLAEVQLWGVSKVADVEGWTPPQQHQDSELQWPGAQQPSGSSPALKLLARAAGGYLPTQVVRLVPGSTDGYVTAQVLIQLHSHQFVRHHEGGSPSTLLLMDLELWQNEVLLSSSPLLSLPHGCNTSGLLPAATAWWWGASDRSVAAAMLQLQQCAEQCLQDVSQEGAPEAIQAYVQFLQDLATWLLQVQRTACTHRLCCCSQPGWSGGVSKGAAVHVHQPSLPAAALVQLGQDLSEYATQMGWGDVSRMVRQQMQSVGVPAMHRGQVGTTPGSWGRVLMQKVWPVFAGYACRHDERLYKQRLAGLLMRGVLLMSSTGNLLIFMIFSGRESDRHMDLDAILCLGGAVVWALLHLAAVTTALGLKPRVTGTPKGSLPLPVRFATWAYLWRALVWLVHALRGSPMFAAFFSSHTSSLSVQSMLAVTEKMQAITGMPSLCMLAMSLLVELPTILLAAPSKALTVPMVVAVRVLVDVCMRQRLMFAPSKPWPTKAATAHQKVQ